MLRLLLIGNESLTIQCGEMALARGHGIAAVVTRSAEVRHWAEGRGLRAVAQGPDAVARLGGLTVDWLLSVANLNVIPEPVLTCARRGAVNFHDGPLPRHAGLNAPVWALLAGEAQHGITWHRMTGGVDEGAILEQRIFDIHPDDTALTLNTRCFEAAIDSFPALLDRLESGDAQGIAQDLSDRSLHLRSDRPAAAGRIDFTGTAEEALRLVRALDHGSYLNPLTCAKIAVQDRVLAVGKAALETGAGAPGAVLEATEAGLVVACSSGALRLMSLRDMGGNAVCPRSLGVDRLPSPDAKEAAHLTAALAGVAAQEAQMRRALAGMEPAAIAGTQTTGAADWQRLDLPGAWAAKAFGALRALGLTAADHAHSNGADPAPGYVSPWSPLTVTVTGSATEAQTAFDVARKRALGRVGFATDLPLRDPALAGLRMPQVALNEADAPLLGSVITLTAGALHYDRSRLPDAEATALAARIATFAAGFSGEAEIATLPILPPAEAEEILQRLNATETGHDRSLTVHRAFEAQVARTPEAIALVFEGTALTYAALNARANRAAHVLRDMGVRPGTLVGLCVTRSVDLLVGALAIQKAGGAYVPMDPAYPAERIALYIEDSAAPVIVTQSGLATTLTTGTAQVLEIDRDPRLATAATTDPDAGAGPDDLAYMIYTSGSTGRPKGVMVEHRNVTNFFTGMDARIGTEPGVWLAVTSLSFDISVLELFWTLARGFKVVISSDENRALVSSGRIATGQGMEFSLYYWGNDDGVGPKKYELLLEGAKFADANGFVALWTPERHFHAFGGPYPNPSVTGAAVAAVTKNLAVRAGSCVVPLHHPARIAEEWAVIDNLTNGRVGMAIASGWQPEDFVLRPENTPPANKAAMYAAADQVRRLWRGEAVEFPKADGTMLPVVTQPRPVSKELPLWVTTAGNPDTWREAGALGANVLTHLLGQSVDEVAEKIGFYHEALRAAGHDPADHKVTLMLHTYVGPDRDTVRRVAEGPMKAYLAAAVGLVKQYAWAFPAFKKPQGVTNPMQIDLRSLSDEENAAILDFAFQRYFEDSGLFGTIGDCLDRVESLKRIGVNEVACLIDYGIAPEMVLEGLTPLAEVLRRSNAGAGPEEGDWSIAAQLLRHRVTHLQCTPSMARMIAMNDQSRAALAGVKTLMLGGEALPSALVRDLQDTTQARILNMYGPTETTIWSTVEEAMPGDGIVNIGTPIANTQVYVLDEALQPVPRGIAGELWIGGEGVTRGYWQREDLTAERFRPNPFHAGRMYRTGDLVRLRADGRLDFLGRADHQVKLRGYRIELGEIETVLEAQPGVAQAVVMAREDSPGDLRLVAYLRGAATGASLRAALAAVLPDHMVPQHFVTLDSFPLTPNRKVDRKALPPPSANAPVATAPDFVAPAGLEGRIAAIWARILGLPKVGAKDNFFGLGGHSLLAVQAHREIRAELGAAAARLSITDIFRFPTLAALAAHLEGSTASGALRPAAPRQPPPSAPLAPAGATHGPLRGISDRADARAEAMERRRAMRAGRAGRTGVDA
ncbi:LLM class flavin-dependent oxidoreductase [Tabrizicola sp. DMG-N-6]|uniref:LLM class flavin-dependent oxidoreductase n=2 Tax=Szabonella alba TaxID=2804194 RepID=A0A8K0V909_9RHOB|nr:MupA/Atu3671 family FMN-dependent luciferase-like monooxygenase [Szabonella alba]MBL4915898.1 LLM class flavin-dependent oxidoreductase [Szabonella alba]